MTRPLHLGKPWAAVICVVACVTAFAHSPTSAAAAIGPVTWLFFVDDLHLEFRNTGRIRDAMRRVVADFVEEGDRFAIRSAGPSGLAVDVTDDRQLLDAAVKKTTGNALRFDDIMDAPSGPAEARYRASTALAAAQSMLDNLSLSPTESAVLLYFSNGYSFELLPDDPPSARSGPPRFNITQAQLRGQLTQLTATAANAAVRIFALDLRTGFADPAAAPSHPAWPDHRDEMRRVMQSLSDDAGGFAIVEGDLEAQLRRVKEWLRR